MGPEESASSERSGTSGTSRLILAASGAAMARRPPLTAEKCLRSVLTSWMGAPEASSSLMEGDGVVERDARVQGQIEHGRAAAGDEEEDQGLFVGPAQHGQRGAGGGEGGFIGRGMAALEVAEAPTAFFGKLVGAADAAQPFAAAHAAEQNLQHGRGGLAKRDDKDLLVTGEIDCLRPAAFGQEAMECIAIEAEAAIKGRGDAAFLDGAGKDFGGRVVQGVECVIVGRSHRDSSLSLEFLPLRKQREMDGALNW